MVIEEELRTLRLALRSLASWDAGGPYADWMADEEVLRFTESRFAEHDRASLTSFIDEMNRSADNLLLGMFLRETNAHIGNIKLGPINRHHRHGYLGLMIGDKRCWGRGLAAEAIEAISAYGFHALGLRRIAAGIYENNVGSLRAFEKSGFREVARLPRWHQYGDELVDDVIVMRESAA